MRIAHYVVSTHWDREWYESFQGYRMRLVSLLDEVFEIMRRDDKFASFVMDSQVIPILDYLEIRPEKGQLIRQHLASGRLRVGPWYVLPDEWLVSGESIIRNLQLGMQLAAEMGGETSRAGFVCDQFGHIGQLPQIFNQLGLPMAFVWRGTHEKDHKGHFQWQSPDGSSVPTYRFGPVGYSTLAINVRNARDFDGAFDLNPTVDRLVQYTLEEATRSPIDAILLFDGGDHMEAEPRTSEMIAAANQNLRDSGIQIVHSDLDRYMKDALRDTSKITKRLEGELRETGRESATEDQQWLIPGVLSSRIHLKQMNAACEDELCLWAEPFSTFAAMELGLEYPSGYLRTAWRHLLENHPHDSICGCSIDQVHKDMEYRFDQSLGISSRLTSAALTAITQAAGPVELPNDSLVLGVFNCTGSDVVEPVDLEIALPGNWPKTFQEFFGYEEKFAFKIRGPKGEEIPYQLVSQHRGRAGFRRPRYKWPDSDNRHVVTVCCPIEVPAFGYTTLTVEPAEPPTRYLGSMATSHREMENEFLRVRVNDNGTIRLTDKRNNREFDNILTFEQRADVGDGWYHGLAVNDEIFLSTASAAEVSLVADGRYKTTFRVAVTMHVPEAFDFAKMRRSEMRKPLRIISDITLRKGCDRVEVETVVENDVRDHRVRVLFPTGMAGERYWADSAFDVIERPVKLAADNESRRELDVEGRPQQTFTAFGNGKVGLSVVSRGVPESAVLDQPQRTIALTLLRSFRRAVFSGDNEGGQVQGTRRFRYVIIPFSGELPVTKFLRFGQRINSHVRQVQIAARDMSAAPLLKNLPRSMSFLKFEGASIISSIQHQDPGTILVRLFNPMNAPDQFQIRGPALPDVVRKIDLTGKGLESASIQRLSDSIACSVGSHEFVNILCSFS